MRTTNAQSIPSGLFFQRYRIMRTVAVGSLPTKENEREPWIRSRISGSVSPLPPPVFFYDDDDDDREGSNGDNHALNAHPTVDRLCEDTPNGTQHRTPRR